MCIFIPSISGPANVCMESIVTYEVVA
jgi:hypothetical protein